MNILDFFIGLEFRTAEGCRWRCTDVGTRTILAIEIDSPKGPQHADPIWFQGPPYLVEEVVFNESEIAMAFTSPETMLLDRLERGRGHPGFSMDAMLLMFDDRGEDTGVAYPHPRVLKHDRVDERDVWHPYSADLDEQQRWRVNVYGLFTKTTHSFLEGVFVHLPLVQPGDFERMHAIHPRGNR